MKIRILKINKSYSTEYYGLSSLLHQATDKPTGDPNILNKSYFLPKVYKGYSAWAGCETNVSVWVAYVERYYAVIMLSSSLVAHTFF